MNVLSLFDGISCGQEALKRAGIKVDNYFASEIDKHAIKIAMKNYPNTIQLGDVTKINSKDLPKIDMLIGGSPCQGFSFAGKQLNFNDDRSKLFFEYVRLNNELQPKWFLLENVPMKKQYERVITNQLKIAPVEINSSWIAAQNRPRLYWTNIPIRGLPEDKKLFIKDIIMDCEHKEVKIKNKDCIRLFKNHGQHAQTKKHKGGQGYYFVLPTSKSFCLTTNTNSVPKVLYKNKIILLNPIECERLQTLSDNYTEGIADNQRYKCLGNGWTVEVISWIFSFINKKHKSIF
jgi:site-specific DNA-cytosine methylase